MFCTRIFQWHKRFYEGREEVKDESKKKKLSTRRSEVNIKLIRQLVCGDNHLTVRLIACQLVIKKESAWKIITEDLSTRKSTQTLCSKTVE